MRTIEFEASLTDDDDHADSICTSPRETSEAQNTGAPYDAAASKRRRLNSMGADDPFTLGLRSGLLEVSMSDPREEHSGVEAQAGTFVSETHTFMQRDSARTGALVQAVKEASLNKIVLDLGTGPGAILAIAAAQGGASSVYAVEGDVVSAAAAVSAVAASVTRGNIPHGVVQVVCAASWKLTKNDIPEGCVQLLAHELLGYIASAEGVLPFVNEVARFLAPGCVSVPHHAETMIAPAKAPPLKVLRAVPPSHRLVGPAKAYLVCAGPVPSSMLLAHPQAAEEVCFATLPVVPSEVEARTLHFTMEAQDAAQWAGYLLYMRFQAAEHSPWVDTISQPSSWQAIWIPRAATLDPTESQQKELQEDSHMLHTKFDGWSRTPSYRIGNLQLGLAELFPITGGMWCRLCGETSLSDAEIDRAWSRCRGCKNAYHQACVVSEKWEPRLGGCNWRRWWCKRCHLTSSEIK